MAKPRFQDYYATELTLVVVEPQRPNWSAFDAALELWKWAEDHGLKVLRTGEGGVCRACAGHGWVDATPDVPGCIRSTVDCPDCRGGKTAKAAYDVALEAWQREEAMKRLDPPRPGGARGSDG